MELAHGQVWRVAIDAGYVVGSLLSRQVATGSRQVHEFGKLVDAPAISVLFPVTID
jgi:hypothetical protein